MTRRRFASHAALVLLLAGCHAVPPSSTSATATSAAAPAPTPAAPPDSAAARSAALEGGDAGPPELLGAETFDAAWAIVRDTYFDPAFGGVDWDEVRDELRPQAESAATTEEIRDVVNEMVSRLGASHFGVLPRQATALMQGGEPVAHGGRDGASAATSPAPAGERSRDAAPAASGAGAAAEGSVDLDVRLIGGRVLVTRVGAAVHAERVPIRTGWAIASVGGHTTAALLASLSGQSPAYARYATASTVRRWLEGAAGSVVRIVAVDGAGTEHVVDAERTADGGTAVTFGALPRMSAVLEAREATAEELRDAGAASDSERPRVGLIRFNIWMVPVATPFHEAIDRYRNADAIVVDLRGNPGGIGALAMGLAGHFCNRPASLGAFRTRDALLEFRVNPRRVTAEGVLTAPFARPVAIVVDDLTASTSEIFAGGLQAIGRARVFGVTTAGAALPAQMSRLPNGDALLHAVADFLLPNGTRIEGRGVVPDEVVETTQQDLLAGRDAPLAAAIRWATLHAASPARDTPPPAPVTSS